LSVGQLSLLLEAQEAKSNATNTTSTNFFIQLFLMVLNNQNSCFTSKSLVVEAV
jgi:hypothetical protein